LPVQHNPWIKYENHIHQSTIAIIWITHLDWSNLQFEIESNVVFNVQTYQYHIKILEIHGVTLKTHCLINTKNAWPLIGHAKYGGMARHVVRASLVGVT
jgi:hypothetical protein